MNFLSHYYFDRNQASSYQVLGALLPDLVKNGVKNRNIFPEKLNPNIFHQPYHAQILCGWKKHLLVDKYFHTSQFFKTHQHQLKLLLIPLLKNSVVKPFFLAHIGVELLLDSLLITQQVIDVEQLYQKLNETDDLVLIDFLQLSNLTDTQGFLKYYQQFKTDKYILAYADTSKISYSLKRICMRVWDNPFSVEQEKELTHLLSEYKIKLSQNFIFIFETLAISLKND